MKKLLTFVLILATGFSAFAQELKATSFLSDPVNHPLAPLYALIFLIVLIIIMITVVGIAMIRVVNGLTDRAAKERAEKEGKAYRPRPSYWSRLIQTANASVAVEDEKTIELNHAYDGIRELDNHLPPWWKWLFYATIVWAGVYMVIYHFGGSLPLMEEEYRNEVALAQEQRNKFLASQPKVNIDENALTYAHDDAIIAKGKEIYSINCSPCHKNDGGGGIGPNLVDEYWLHGGDVKDVYATIKNGVPEKGMVSWASVLSPEQLRDVSFFIMSIKGSNPAGAKGPQGEIFKSTAGDVEADSTTAQTRL